MVNHTSPKGLLHELQELVQAHRSAFKQERPFWRAVGLVLGEVFNFGGTGAVGTGYSAGSDLKKRN